MLSFLMKITKIFLVSTNDGDFMALIETVKAKLDEIRPRLQADGGDLEFVSLQDGGQVQVRLTGACAGCPMATMTIKQSVERELRESIPEVTEVVQVA
jgi:Fe-S cluster biogenesis protein NfuA